ncbi:MAG: tRNA (adenosine(37)-N6)-dimethylallyltransferase MiaA [Flavobacterium sp.]|nr:tRNA (adenosine(37)-N6)-dimethylallyltransferase MiaA [Flavobacterium sp.]
MNYLIVVVGPTAIGKTAHSIALAQALGCEILSCDSRQFYKEMRIGTAVPEPDELAAAPHHFIQHKSIRESYNVGAFEKEAIAKLDELYTKSNTAIMVGGSGLYVNAVLYGLDTFPPIEVSIRESIQAHYAAQGIEYLQNELKRLDPAYYQTIQTENPQTLQNPQRLMRFVEVCVGTKKPYSSFLQQVSVIRNFTPILIGLDAPREVLYERINLRVDQMMEKGLVQEVIALQDEQDNNALQTVGYKELFAHLNRNCSLSEAVDAIKQNTRRYAKRQLTWFKRNADIQWFDYQSPTASILDYINSKRN